MLELKKKKKGNESNTFAVPGGEVRTREKENHPVFKQCYGLRRAEIISWKGSEKSQRKRSTCRAPGKYLTEGTREKKKRRRCPFLSKSEMHAG